MDEFNLIVEPARAFLVQVGAYLPRLAVALAVAIIGWLVAKAVRFAAIKTLRALNFHVLTERAGVDAFLQQGGTTKDTTDVFGALIYWVVILVALIIAFNGLGLTQVTDLLSRVLLFLPKLLVGLLVIILGAYFGRFVGNAVLTYCRNIGVADADVLARIAQYTIVVFVILIAIDQLDLGGALVQQTFLILLAGLVFALALAFGLGGRDVAAALLHRWFPPPEPGPGSPPATGRERR
jgi:flagellar biosynthesis protein FliQ